ncbi:MAG: hypothetical protein Q7R86_03180 [bacterium]|nr:hypothetical protein [bacterium]
MAKYSDENKDLGEKSFQRSRKTIADKSFLRVSLATASLFVAVFSFKTLIGFVFPNIQDFAAWLSTLFPFSLFAYIYNSMAQTKGIDIKNALLLDWVDLSYRTHMLIIFASGLTLLIPKLLAWVSGLSFTSSGQDSSGADTIANGQ